MLICAVFLFLQLKECNSLYEGYVPMKYKHYCKKMKKYGYYYINFAASIIEIPEFVIFLTVVLLKIIFSRYGEWGDHVTLQAAADKVIHFYAMFLTSFALLKFHAAYVSFVISFSASLKLIDSSASF